MPPHINYNVAVTKLSLEIPRSKMWENFYSMEPQVIQQNFDCGCEFWVEIYVE
jgi:hypothetical protein